MKPDQYKPNKLIIIISLLLLCAITVSFAAAEMDVVTYTFSKDFNLVASNTASNVCSCAQQIDSITVENTGSYTATFYVSIDKDLSDRLKISESSFELAAGDSRKVFLYYNAPCNTGRDDFTLTVSSNLGVQKSISKSMIRNRCQNVELWVSNNIQSTKPCQDAVFTLFVKNAGPFSDDYILSSNADNYVKYTSNSFTLLPNQIAVINTTARFGCEAFGQKNIVFNARSLKNGLQADIGASINILKDYDYTITVNNDFNANQTIRQAVDVCNRLYFTQIPVTIKNNGVNNTFKVDINGLPGFAKINGIGKGMEFSLGKGESKTFYIEADSHDFRSEYKDYDINIKLTPKLGDNPMNKGMTLRLSPCYEHTIKIVDKNSYAPTLVNSEKNPLQACSGKFYSYDVEVKNNGKYKENMALFIEGASPSDFTLSTYSITLNPQESRTVKLFLIAPENNIKYNAKVIAKLSNGLYELDNLWVQSYDTTECHKIIFAKSDYKINYDAKQIIVPIDNKAIADSSFFVDWNGTSLIGLNGDVFTLNHTASKSSIVLNIDSFKVPEGKYDGTLTLREKGSSAIYSDDITISLHDKSLFTKAIEFMAIGSICRQVSLTLIVAILAICLLIIIFLIVGPNYPYKFWNRVKLKIPILIVLIAIFILGMIIVVIVAGFPKTYTQVYNLTTNASQLRFEWVENDKYVLDAGQFFHSPENNPLTYKVSDVSNIKSRIDGSLITFYPDLGWSGSRSVIITAFDKFGGSVASPQMTLSVLPLPKKSPIEIYSIYCWYVNLAIFALLLIIIFLAFLVKQKKRTRK